MRAIYVRLSQQTLDRLSAVAYKERRDPRDQAAVLIEWALRSLKSQEREGEREGEREDAPS